MSALPIAIPLLLVDDRQANIVALEAVFESTDYEIAVAYTGRDALRLLGEREFAVVLLDARMPEMDGFEAASRMKQIAWRGAPVPVIFVTAADMTGADVARAYAAGAADVIQKPLDPTILRAKVAVFAELYRARQGLAAALTKASAASESEEQLRILVESVRDYAIFVLDPQGFVTSWNAGAERIKGYGAAEIIGKHFSVFYPPEDVKAGKCDYELEVAARVGRFEDEGWRLRKDGSRFWANVVITAVHDATGRLVGFGKITRDLTLRVQGEQERVQRVSQRLETHADGDRAAGTRPIQILLVDDVPENLRALEVLLRREGVECLKARSGAEALELLLVHDVGLALVDVQMPDMDGFELAEIMRGTDRTRHVPIIFLTAGSREPQRVFRGYEVGAVDFLFKPVDPVLLVQKVGIFVGLRRQVLQREQLADELSEALRLNELFVAAVSHDLRSPLNTVSMGAALLDRAPAGDPAAARRTAARIASSAARMTRLLDQLYDLARARLAGGIVIERRETNFRAIADTVSDELRTANPERALTVECDDEATHGKWDEERLRQVLANLVGNALRYGARDEPVRVRVRGNGPTLVVEVHNGGEIDAGIRPYLFDPFRGSQRTARDSLGLGLYIVRQIVLAHRGTIDVTSSAEAGTTFRVELPRA